MMGCGSAVRHIATRSKGSYVATDDEAGALEAGRLKRGELMLTFAGDVNGVVRDLAFFNMNGSLLTAKA